MTQPANSAAVGQAVDSLVTIYLWCTAPGCWTLPNNHPDRWRIMERATPAPLMARRILGRLNKLPAEVKVVDHADGVVILGECEIDPAQGMFPLATILSGATFEAIEEARLDLIEAGWRPSTRPPTVIERKPNDEPVA